MTTTTVIAALPAETGWKRLDGNAAQYTGPLDNGSRDIMRVLARLCDGEPVLLIRTAYLDGDEDPADQEAIDNEFESGFSALCELHRDAVLILHGLLGGWLRTTDSQKS